MWANAERDGRSAEHRWRPLFNAAVWLTPTTWLPCSNSAKTRKTLKLAGVPQTGKPISVAIGAKCTILWRRLEDILLLNNVFPIVDMCLSCKDTARQSCAMVPPDGDFWRLFCVLYLQRAACSTFQICILNSHGATPCVEVWQTSNLRWLRLGEEKRKIDR